MASLKIAGIITLLLALLAPPAMGAQEGGERLVKVVALSRHGVRAPTQSDKTLALWSRKTWPEWPVARGDLTERGFRLVKAQWQYLRGLLAENGLLQDTMCAPKDEIYVRSDTDERDQATSQAILDGLGSDCKYEYAMSDEEIDPLFHPVKAGLYRFDPIQVATDVQMMTNGGFEHLQETLEGGLNLLGRISGSPAPELCRKYSLSPNCQFAEIPNAVSVSPEGNDIRISGGLGMASSMAEIFLLEYAQWPGMAAGWGQVNATVLGQILPVHSRVFNIVNRAPVVAWARGSGLLREINAALQEKHEDSRINRAKIVVFVGHDTNIANLGALLGVRWHARGYPLNGIPPGAFMCFELWQKGEAKEVRLRFFAQKPNALHAEFEAGQNGGVKTPANNAPAEAANMPDNHASAEVPETEDNYDPAEATEAADNFAPTEATVWAQPGRAEARYELDVFGALVEKATAGAPLIPRSTPRMRNFGKTLQ